MKLATIRAGHGRERIAVIDGAKVDGRHDPHILGDLLRSPPSIPVVTKR